MIPFQTEQETVLCPVSRVNRNSVNQFKTSDVDHCFSLLRKVFRGKKFYIPVGVTAWPIARHFNAFHSPQLYEGYCQATLPFAFFFVSLVMHYITN